MSRVNRKMWPVLPSRDFPFHLGSLTTFPRLTLAWKSIGTPVRRTETPMYNCMMRQLISTVSWRFTRNHRWIGSQSMFSEKSAIGPSKNQTLFWLLTVVVSWRHFSARNSCRRRAPSSATGTSCRAGRRRWTFSWTADAGGDRGTVNSAFSAAHTINLCPSPPQLSTLGR